MKNILFLILLVSVPALAELGWSNGGVFTANQFSSNGPLACSTFTDYTQIATPANPAASHNRLYFKAGDHLYMLNSAGAEVQVDGGGGGGPDTTSIARDGSRPPTAAQPWNGQDLTGVGNLSATASVAVGPNGATNVTARVNTENAGPGDRGIINEQHTNTGNGPLITFKRSRNSTASPAVIANGNETGKVQGQTYDGTAYITNWQMQSVVDGTVATNQIPTDLKFNLMDQSGNLNNSFTLLNDQTAKLTGQMKVGNLVGTNEAGGPAATGPMGLIVGNTGSTNLTSAGMSISSYDTGSAFGLTVPTYRLRRAHGSEGAPTNLLTGDGAGQLMSDTWTSSGWKTAARIRLIATENQDDTHFGTKISLWPMPNGNTTSGALQHDFGADGSVTLGAVNTGSLPIVLNVPHVNGSAAANGSLTLTSTSDATKGNVQINDGSVLFLDDPADSFSSHLAGLFGSQGPYLNVFSADNNTSTANQVWLGSNGPAGLDSYACIGNYSAPAQFSTDQSIWVLTPSAYNGTGTFEGNQNIEGQLALRADEVHTTTAMGSRWELKNVMRGTLTRAVTWLVDSLGDMHNVLGNIVVDSAGKAVQGQPVASGNLNLSSTSNATKGFVQVKDGSYMLYQQDPGTEGNFVGSTAETDYKTFINNYAPGTTFYYGYVIPQDINTNTGAPVWFNNLIENGAGFGGNGGAQIVMSSARASAGGDDWNHASFVKQGDAIASIYPSVYGKNFTGNHAVDSVPAGYLGWNASEDHNDTAAGTNFIVQTIKPGTQTPIALQYGGDGSLHLGITSGQPEDMTLRPNTTVTTTDATVTTLQTIPLNDNQVTYLSAKCTARRTDAADRGVYEEKVAMFREAGGGATMQGSVNEIFAESSDVTWGVTWTVSGNNALLQANGAVGKTVNWHCITEIEEGQ